MSLLWLAAVLALGWFVHRRILAWLGPGRLVHVLRLPGNLLHEVAHAVATLACGYTIVGFTVSLFDPAERGGVRPGPAWTRFTRPWVANLVSPIAPLAAGIVALRLLARWSGAPTLPRSFAGAYAVASGLPFRSWELWAALVLAVPVCAEMCPSDVDLRAWARPAAIVGLLAGAAAWAVEHWYPGLVWGYVRPLDPLLTRTIAPGLSLAAWSTLAWLPPALIVRWLRR
jgi:hypothetical protein